MAIDHHGNFPYGVPFSHKRDKKLLVSIALRQPMRRNAGDILREFADKVELAGPDDESGLIESDAGVLRWTLDDGIEWDG